MSFKQSFDVKLNLLERLYIRGNTTILPKEIGDGKFINLNHIIFLLKRANETGGGKVTIKERDYIKRKTERKLEEEPENNRTYGMNVFDYVRSLRKISISEEFQYSRNLDVLIRELKGVNYEVLNND